MKRLLWQGAISNLCVSNSKATLRLALFPYRYIPCPRGHFNFRLSHLHSEDSFLKASLLILLLRTAITIIVAEGRIAFQRSRAVREIRTWTRPCCKGVILRLPRWTPLRGDQT